MTFKVCLLVLQNESKNTVKRAIKLQDQRQTIAKLVNVGNIFVWGKRGISKCYVPRPKETYIDENLQFKVIVLQL